MFFPFVLHAETRYSAQSILDTISNVFSRHGEDVVSQAVYIARCESRLNNLAVNEGDKLLNGHFSIGVYQISQIHGHDEEYLLTPYNNIKEAEELYTKFGWKPWRNCFNKLSRGT